MNVFVNLLLDGVVILGFGEFMFCVREKRRCKGGRELKESRVDEIGICISFCVIFLRMI